MVILLSMSLLSYVRVLSTADNFQQRNHEDRAK